MNRYWGDLHNHCGITYGYGSLKHALDRAKSHLDFCAVTGHAMWPDIPERNEETAFVVDFHHRGFQKLYDHWEEVRHTIAEANTEDFITFQAYEMHSSLYGDHHIVTPDDSLPLIYRDSPAQLLHDSGCDGITVAHHIGYTPGYRGINWDLYDPAVTPLIEVCSKHGCGMSETAPYPYYHNMGPRDSRCTVYEGLKRGFHFGFVGSTDHHAGYPGSYGDGKLAVLAESKTRSAIWDGLKNRRTYAVTGDRIKCDFSVDGHLMGSIVPLTSPRHQISYRVEGCANIDKIVIYRNLNPIHIAEGLTMIPKSEDNRYKIRIEMGWGNNEQELFPWKGRIRVSDGQILEAEPCFRGRSVLAPSASQDVSQDNINEIDNRILSISDDSVSWQCFTVKNPSPVQPQTCAVIAEIQGSRDTVVEIEVNGHCRRTSIGELCIYGYSEHMKPYHSQAYKVHTAVSCSQYTAENSFTDEWEGPAFYHMEVAQTNQQWAFVSPIFFE